MVGEAIFLVNTTSYTHSNTDTLTQALPSAQPPSSPFPGMNSVHSLQLPNEAAAVSLSASQRTQLVSWYPTHLAPAPGFSTIVIRRVNTAREAVSLQA